jgi:beta-glucosidase
LGRDIRWGRNEESFGEDAWFNGTMVVAMVKGLQGDNPKYWRTAALLKHFLANSNEDTRDRSSSDFDERLFREYYSVPFRMGIVDGGARAYMAAYNAYNGIPCTVHPILKNVTVKEWGQDGIICTDAGGMRNLITAHKYLPDDDHAAAASILAGITQFLDRYPDAVRGALKNKLLTETDIDNVIRGNFRVMIRLGLLDPPEMVPYTNIHGTDDPWLSDKHKSLAHLVTQKSIVLLKNSNDLLPLDKAKLKSIAVIGPRGNEVLMDWYSGTAPHVVTPLEGIKNKVGANVTVSFASGNDQADAVKLARSSDIAIVCVGNHPDGGENVGWAKVSFPSEGREAVDRKSITLEQEELIKQVYAANPRTIVVLISSFPYAINWTRENVPAIIHMTHSSEEEGNALADVLFGDFNPAGRLVQTWPRSIDDLPPLMDYNIRHGRTYMYFKGRPLYPFGFGLSYSTFEYSHLKIDSSVIKTTGSVKISVDVKNTGKRSGEEVVQLYVSHLDSSVERPAKELNGFERVQIDPGKKQTINMSLSASQLGYWNTEKQSFVVESDKVQIMIGSSSSDIRLRKTIAVEK